jgi:ketosteroid isomerase-like protein
MADVADLLERNDRWQRCIQDRDVHGIAELLDDDYTLVLVQPVRTLVPRDQWLKTLPDYHEHEWKVQERVVELDGDVGVILQRVHMRATVHGADRSGIFVLSDIWRRRDGRWRVWRRHSTPLSAGVMPEAPSTTA